MSRTSLPGYPRTLHQNRSKSEIPSIGPPGPRMERRHHGNCYGISQDVNPLCEYRRDGAWCSPIFFLPKTINSIQQLWCDRGFVGTPRCWLLIFVSSMTHMPSYAHVTKSGWHHPIDIPIYLGHLGTSSFPLNWLSILFLRENGCKSRQSDLQDMHGGFLGALTLNSAQTLMLSPWMLQMPRASTMQLRNTWTEDHQQTQIYGSEAVEWTQSADSASQKKETHHVKTLKLQVPIP